jgi:hypothetical protein
MMKPLVAIVVVLAMIGTLLWLVQSLSSPTILALGSTDLEIQFLVTDASTGQPVPGAVVQLWTEDRDRLGIVDEQQIATDQTGHAIYKRGECSCEDVIRPFRPTKTFYNLTWGEFAVKAKGYNAMPRTWLHTTRYEVTGSSSSKEGRFSRLQFSIPLTAARRQERASANQNGYNAVKIRGPPSCNHHRGTIASSARPALRVNSAARFAAGVWLR